MRVCALTLTDAALIAEFEDNEQVVRDLLSAIKGGFSAEHIAQQARDEKVRQQAYDEAVTALTETGVTVIDRPGYDEKVIQALRDVRLLNKDDSAKKKAPTVDEHATCPGHAAYVSQGYGEPRPTYVCINPKANKHALYSWKGTTLPNQRTGGGMTEEQKAERRTLIENNKQWDSAETVRRAWLSEAFLTRTSPPKAAETFLCRRGRCANGVMVAASGPSWSSAGSGVRPITSRAWLTPLVTAWSLSRSARGLDRRPA